MGQVGTLKRLAVALVATTALLGVVAVSGAAPGTDASVTTFDQCANGGPPGTSTACPDNWINGILNANNSHYAEDDVTPQRVILELPKNSPTTGRTVEISYLTRKGGVHAYDSLATWNYTQTTADRCANLTAADCVAGAASTLPVPSDPTVVADNNGSGSATSAHQLAGQVFTMYGGTLTGASAYTHDDPSGTSDSYARITLTYSVPSTADGAKVMLLFGGHIAPSIGPRGWGAGVGAGAISGGPYHVRITAADGASVGNRDNQIMSSAILAPATIVIRKNTVGGDATFGYTTTGGLSPSSFSIATSGGTGSQAYANIAAGSYTVTESTLPAGWDFTNLVCVDEDNGSTVDLANRKANIDLDPGETVTCTFTNSKRGNIVIEKQTLPDGATQQFTFTRSYGSNVQLSDGQQDDSGPLAPGTYSVSETFSAGWNLTSATCDDGSSPSSISLQAGETVKCTFNNAQNGTVIVKKVMVGGTDSFSFSGTPSGPIAVNNGTIQQSVAPGQYISTEAAKAGWDLSSVVCDDGNSTGSPGNRTATFNVEAGETVTCTFTNTKLGKVIVKKVMVGGTDTFDFTGTPSGPISQNDGTISADVAPGQYVSTESAKAGWDLTAISCDDANSIGSLQNRQATFNVAAGETVTCTFTNEKDSGITVVKQTNPDGDPQSFTFSASYDADGFALKDGESNNSGDLDPGTYSVSETVPAGWDLDSATCSDGSAPSAIALSAGEAVTCTFTNEKDAKIVVQKQTNPDGDPQSFSFSASYDANGFSLSDGQSDDSGDLDPGTYSVSENVPAGWDLVSAVCSDQSSPSAISLQAGETVTCVFTNVKDAKIVVSKQTDPDGSQQSFSFSASYDGNGFSLSDGQSNDSGDLDPGTYSVSENVPAGWDLQSAVCSDQSLPSAISLQAGETVTCVFTNKLRRGQIIVSKQTNPDGDPQSFSFSASYDADGFALSDGQSNNSGDLLPGSYSVSETVPAGWDLESATCDDGSAPGSIALAAGETVTCVFTNEKDANIVVSKQTNPDGDPQSFSFTASYDADGFALSDGQSNNSGDLDPGTYSVAETVPQGWDLESALCDDESSPSAISLQAGETVRCTFTNEKDARIIVQKVTNPSPNAQLFAFSASYDGDGFSLAGGQSNDSGDLDPGTYSVSENVPDGWDLSSAVCSDESEPSSIALAAGETVTCVFTNTKRGTIIVEKQTAPNNASGSFSFSGTAAGSIADGGQIVVSNLVPGTYTSTEAQAQDWTLTAITCDDANSTGSLGTRTATFRLEAGEIVKCTFANAKLGQGSISVSKSANPTTLKEPGGPVTFSVTITNTSADVDVTVLNVVDDKFGDLDDDGGNGCFDVPINMPPGAKANCTFQKTISGTGGTSHVNVVTVTGRDENGNSLTASDDAKVDITPRLIDLVIVKEATSPTPLNGTVNYSLTVTNKGPDTATNVQLADPAPAGITYLTANPSQGTCNLSPALITCALGNIAAGQTVTIAITGRATAVGSHTNTATVTGGGGRETNPADNVDTAVTVVPAPLKPPTVKPEPKPEVCLSLTVSPKMIKADGKPDKVTAKVTAGSKRVKGVKVSISGAGVSKTGRTNGKGVAVLRINPKKPGIITVTVVETNQKLCGPKRIGVVGVFLPPLTG